MYFTNHYSQNQCTYCILTHIECSFQVLSQLRQMICPDPEEIDEDIEEIEIEEETFGNAEEDEVGKI